MFFNIVVFLRHVAPCGIGTRARAAMRSAITFFDYLNMYIFNSIAYSCRFLHLSLILINIFAFINLSFIHNIKKSYYCYYFLHWHLLSFFELFRYYYRLAEYYIL